MSGACPHGLKPAPGETPARCCRRRAVCTGDARCGLRAGGARSTPAFVRSGAQPPCLAPMRFARMKNAQLRAERAFRLFQGCFVSTRKACASGFRRASPSRCLRHDAMLRYQYENPSIAHRFLYYCAEKAASPPFRTNSGERFVQKRDASYRLRCGGRRARILYSALIFLSRSRREATISSNVGHSPKSMGSIDR